jgi:glycosyltransferase involved in cell wall biosynthesis
VEVGRIDTGEVVQFFKTGNVEELADRLQALVDRPEEFADLGRRGAEHVTAEYDWAAIAEKTEKEYEALLGGRR